MSVSEPGTPKPDHAVGQELPNELDNLKAENKKLTQELAQTKRQYMELLENSAATIGNLKKELEEARSELATLAADREELAQLKKQTKEDAAELHREENCMKLEKIRWQREIGNARAELEDAKATMLKQADKIRELERGYSLKPNPAESRLRLEIGDLQAELEAYKQQPAIDLPEQVGEIVNFLKQSLPPDTKWPKRIIPALRKFLEEKED